MQVSQNQARRICDAIAELDSQHGGGYAANHPRELKWALTIDPWWPRVDYWLEVNQIYEVTVAEVLRDGLGIDTWNRGDEMRVALSFKEHGWKRKRVCLGMHREWRYVSPERRQR